MVCLGTKICTECHKEYQGNYHSSDSVCGDCKQAKEDKARKEHFNALNKLSIDARLRKVEEWIYNYKPSRHPEFTRFA